MMRRAILHIACFLLTAALPARAQTGVYLAPGADIAVHKADTVAIFSDVRNEGRFGSLEGAVINFYGTKWENGNDAQLPDENNYNNTSLQHTGGWFRFLQAKGINMGAQLIYGGYSASAKAGASFPNLSVENKNGVQLEDLSDLKIRHTLHFESGHLSLTGWNLVIGERYPGNITGYSEKSFVITGTEPGGGFLYREHVSASDSLVVFPIGSAENSYSPMALRNNGPTPVDVHTRVFDSVYHNAISGQVNGTDYVRKTWNIQQDGDVKNDMTVWLQYNRQDEGEGYAMLRDSSFVSHFSLQGWDTLPPSRHLGKGTLTTAATSSAAYMNRRSFSNGLETNAYLSVTAHNDPGAAVSVFFDAQRQSRRWVDVHWRTTKEKNLLRFELQRRREAEDSFYTVARIAPHNFYGNSNTLQQYHYNDDNECEQWTYYRLKILGRDGSIIYSDIRKVPWLMEIKAFPNPSNGNFNVTLYGISHKLRMVMYDMTGREQGSWMLTGNDRISRPNLPAGIYILTFYDTENNNTVVNNIKIEIF